MCIEHSMLRKNSNMWLIHANTADHIDATAPTASPWRTLVVILRWYFSLIAVVHLLLGNFVQFWTAAARLKLLLRDISLRAFLNGVGLRFDLWESVTYHSSVQIYEWMICAVKMVGKSMTKRLLCSVRVSKRSILWYHLLFEQINHIRTAAGPTCSPQWSLKCRLPNRISFAVLTGASAKLKRGHVKHQLRSFAKRLREPRGHDFARGLTFI